MKFNFFSIFLKKFEKRIIFLFFIGLETFSIVSCSNRDNSPRDLALMTIVHNRIKKGRNEQILNILPIQNSNQTRGIFARYKIFPKTPQLSSP